MSCFFRISWFSGISRHLPLFRMCRFFEYHDFLRISGQPRFCWMCIFSGYHSEFPGAPILFCMCCFFLDVMIFRISGNHRFFWICRFSGYHMFFPDVLIFAIWYLLFATCCLLFAPHVRIYMTPRVRMYMNLNVRPKFSHVPFSHVSCSFQFSG